MDGIVRISGATLSLYQPIYHPAIVKKAFIIIGLQLYSIFYAFVENFENFENTIRKCATTQTRSHSRVKTNNKEKRKEWKEKERVY